MQIIKFNVKKGRNAIGIRQIVPLSSQKAPRVINLYHKYKEIGFTNYNLIDLAEMTMTQWKRREYPIPEGYRLNWGKMLVKLNVRDLIHS